MSTIKVDVSSSKKPVLQVGYQEENEVTDVLFDISAWVEEYGGGTAGLRVKRPQNSEEESYELSLPISENVAIWTVSETDTYNRGNGKVQLKYYVGSALKESAVYTYKVGKSIVGSDNPVDPFDTWIERSKAWAIGELLDGEDVPASDETYHNNSKYYSEQVEGQAAEAKTQADLAKEYAHQFVGAPRAASTAGGMTDHDLIYVFTGTTTSSLTNGHWYYWNGSAWTDGGVYNSTAFTTDTTLTVPGAAADAKVVGDLKEDLDIVTIATSTNFSITGKSVNVDSGELQDSATWSATDYIDISGYADFNVTIPTFTSLNNSGFAFYDNDKTYIIGVLGNVTETASYETRNIIIPSEAKYVRFSFRTSSIGAFRADNVKYKNALPVTYDHLRVICDNSTYKNGYINSINGSQCDGYNYGYRYTEYINIANIKSLVLQMPVLTSLASGAGVAFYDQSKTYISGVIGRLDASGGSEIRVINVPTNAVYMRTCDRSVNWNTFFVKVDEVYVNTKGLEKLQASDTNSYGMQMFEKVGIIGDSIACGWALDKNGTASRRNTGISWPQQMARRLGCTAYNLGASGVDPIEWFQPDFEFAQYCYTQYQSVGFCDLYIIGMGLNQGALGTTADINQSDYTQNSATFYGQYARIIQMINAEHPNAIVMCLTEPTTAISSYDQAVRDICALSFINAELVDLENNYFKLFNTPEILAEHQPDNLHFTPYGYSLIANAMVKALNDFISKNPEPFKFVGIN